MPKEHADENWQSLARDLVQTAIARRNITISELSKLLAEYGLEIETTALRRRINRGSFDAGFLLMCLSALGASQIELSKDRWADAKLLPRSTWVRPKTKT